MKDARTLARELLAMSQAVFAAAFEGSPMKRAKRRGPARNAAVALGTPAPGSGQADLDADVAALEAALEHDEPLVREHAAWALARIDSPSATTASSNREAREHDAAVRAEPPSAHRSSSTTDGGRQANRSGQRDGVAAAVDVGVR